MAEPNAPVPGYEIQALITKHRPEIDRIKVMDAPNQIAAFERLGVDVKALEEHYKDFQVKSDILRRRDAVARKETAALGWISMAAGTGGMLAMGKQLGTRVVRTAIITVTGIASGVIGVFAGSRIFSGKNREQSRQLDIDAKNAFERELAVALENRDRTATAQAPAETVTTSVTSTVTPRDPSFVAQTVADKVIAAATGQNQRA